MDPTGIYVYVCVSRCVDCISVYDVRMVQDAYLFVGVCVCVCVQEYVCYACLCVSL